MSCEKPTVSSNVTGLAVAEEECLRQLPGVGGVDAVWRNLEPNSYPGFGSENSLVARNPISQSRQFKKGGITGKSAKAGYATDITPTNTLEDMQGFLFADARVRGGTQHLIRFNPLKPIVNTVSATSASSKYTLSAAVTGIVAGSLVFAAGWATASNNGLKNVASVTGPDVVVSQSVASEANTTATLTRVGHQFAAGDINVVMTGDVASLSSTAADFTTLGLIPGEYIYLGADVLANRFVNNNGFARIASVSAHSIVFDHTVWTPVAETGTGKQIQIFFGTVVRTEDNPANIVRRTYCFRRLLGSGAVGRQAEYIIGAVPNTFKLNSPAADKLTAELAYLACGSSYVSGETGDLLWPGTEVAAKGEGLINTSTDLVAVRIIVNNPLSSSQAPLFGYAGSFDLTFNNNASEIRALGVAGSLDIAEGNIGAEGTINGYFDDVAACKAMEANADFGLLAIYATANKAQVYDVPLMSAASSELKIEANKPIEIPVKVSGAESKFGHTVLYSNFAYVPTAAS